MTSQLTAAIINRHMARLLTDLEALGCSAEVKNTVRAEMRWLRNDLTKDPANDYAGAVRFYERNVCHLPDEPKEQQHITLESFSKYRPFVDLPNEPHGATVNGSCGRMHEECFGCALRKSEPQQCSGHAQGPVACAQFKADEPRPIAKALKSLFGCAVNHPPK
ncbi:hypothetical protein M0R72_21505 [Candidatus Pacearchaeota archaeon]|jgi:hypothetical protein|nr:hypothetical protein [Candidatus Pacearchaeota archaeon]